MIHIMMSPFLQLSPLFLKTSPFFTNIQVNISWIEVKQGGFGDQNDIKWTISLGTKSCWHHGVDGPSRLNVDTLGKFEGGLKEMKVKAS